MRNLGKSLRKIPIWSPEKVLRLNLGTIWENLCKKYRKKFPVTFRAKPVKFNEKSKETFRKGFWKLPGEKYCKKREKIPGGIPIEIQEAIPIGSLKQSGSQLLGLNFEIFIRGNSSGRKFQAVQVSQNSPPLLK